MKWYVKVLKQYADFEGRARRTEYWMFALFSTIVFIVLGLLTAVTSSQESVSPVVGLLVIYYVGVLVPTLAVITRRLHDTNRSGWWQLLGFVPFGSLVVLVFTILEGDRGPNRFGPDPKAAGELATGGSAPAF